MGVSPVSVSAWSNPSIPALAGPWPAACGGVADGCAGCRFRICWYSALVSSSGSASQLALERRHTDLVLAESGPAPAELRVQAHERPVHRLLEGIEGHQPQSGLHGLVERAGVPLLGEEPRQRVLGELAQPLAARRAATPRRAALAA